MVFTEDEFFIVPFLLQYCLLNGSLLSHVSWKIFLKYYFSSIVSFVVGHSYILCLKISKLIPILAWFFELMSRVTHLEVLSIYGFSLGLHDRYTCLYYF